MFRSFADFAAATARSRSASPKTMNGAQPPSSIEVRSTLSAASRSNLLPTSVDPVKESFRSLGSRSRGLVRAAEDEVGTTLTTPFGTPASRHASAKARAVRGVSFDGFRTPEQPAANAGPSLRVAIARGKFHGVMARTGPTGRGMVITLRLPSGVVE